ncbi:MAG TPA: M23 family metallopeptidase [Nocardioides sp.]
MAGVLAAASGAAHTAEVDGSGSELAERKTLAPVMRIEAKPAPEPEPEWVLPVEGYHLTGRFGASSALWSNTHTGLDFAAPVGTPIRAVTGGVVTESGPAGAFGTMTVVTGPDGTQFWYAHQNETNVAPGQEVEAGSVIGTVGSTGNVTGPHLHLEVRVGPEDPQDPALVLAEHGVRP